MTLKDKTKTFTLNLTQLFRQGKYLDFCIYQSTLLEFFHSEPLEYPVAFSSQIRINPYWDEMVFFPLIESFFRY